MEKLLHRENVRLQKEVELLTDNMNNNINNRDEHKLIYMNLELNYKMK